MSAPLLFGLKGGWIREGEPFRQGNKLIMPLIRSLPHAPNP